MASPITTVHDTASTPRHIFLVHMMDKEKLNRMLHYVLFWQTNHVKKYRLISSDRR